MTRLLVLDVGKTGCRARLTDGGAPVASGEWPGACGVADRDGAQRALAAIHGVTRGWPVPDAVAAGLAGLASAPDRAADIAAGLRERFVPDLRVLLTSDMTTWHAGALGGAPGVVLAAGTGVVALGIDAAGRSARVDGWGHLLGDDGGGFALGRAGLAAALRAHDGRSGGSPALLALLRARFGEPDRLPARVHGADNPAREVAAFARDVLAAAGSGDDVARAIVARAAADLAGTAAAADAAVEGAAPDRAASDPAGPGPSRPVACGGGLLDAGPVLTGPLDAELAARSLTRTRPLGDALDGARLLLEDPHVPHHALTVPSPAGAR
ncbi:BadF/BadG/BcrA/BcrD ATPase family protein [Pseudonocardia nematodicida]|uniref:BadF/BadG/BcrA/BcrD ATPase family protein n=1 Tax=Pseudonocardia nematodicida TaxID=1206997 RepID=A0ABV1KGX1_9PSEU